MKHMRKLFAMALAVMMVLTLATTAFAAEGDKYEIFQIFTGDFHDSVLSNVNWGQNGTGTVSEAVSADVLNALTAVNNGTDAEKLAVIQQYADLTGTPYAAGDADTYTLPNGYYLVRNGATSQEGTGEFYTLYVVKVVDGSLSINPKGDAPEVGKEVSDSDLNIGDTVTFTLTATMPSTFEGYESYKVIFHDTMFKGLTFGAIQSVSVEDYDVVTGTNTDGDTTIDITIDDVLAQGIKAGDTITVTYTATLNSQAVIGVEGNPNEVYLEYSNDPNWNGEGDEPTGDTPEVEVEVYTWDMEVLKYADGDKSKVLEGVKFILLNADKTKIAKVADGKMVSWDTFTEGMAVTDYEMTTDALGKISIDGLESGTYYLRETYALPGYNMLTADVTVTVTAGDIEAQTYTTYVAEVNNQSGSTLPETGGMGTTMFYLFGSVMVLAAVVLLVTKKRMAA